MVRPLTNRDILPEMGPMGRRAVWTRAFCPMVLAPGQNVPTRANGHKLGSCMICARCKGHASPAAGAPLPPSLGISCAGPVLVHPLRKGSHLRNRLWGPRVPRAEGAPFYPQGGKPRWDKGNSPRGGFAAWGWGWAW